MSLQFILGGSGRGKTYYMQNLVTEEARLFPNRQYIFLVPEQFTMQTQKELIRMSEAKGILNIDVQSFLRLAFRVFSETGANNLPVLDDMGKTMILKKVLNNLENQLEYFGKNIHKKGYVQEIKSFLSELLQYGAEEETIDEMIRAAKKHTALERKLRDIKIIYRAFMDYLHEHYITSEEILTVLAGVTKESAILHDSIVCLDGFTGFTPTQYQFIEQLLCVAKKVYISVTMDIRESIVKVGEKHGLFHMSQQTIYRLRNIARENQIEVCPEIWTGERVEETRFAEAPGICALEQRIFRYPVLCFEKETEDISIHVLKQPEKEVSFAVEQIRKLLLDRTCRYRDIAVVTGDLEVYGTLAKEIFEQAQIPCFVDQKKSILANPFVEMLDNVLDIFLSNFQAEKVLAYEKNLFAKATDEQVDLLDNFLRATGIRGYQKWLEVWKCDRVFPGASKEMLEYAELQIDIIRLETTEQLGELYEAIGKGKHTVLAYATAFCEWMEQQQYYNEIQKWVERFTEENELALAREYSQIYEIVLEVFNRLVELLGEEEMNLKEFKEILDTGFNEARIGLIPPGVDQVVIGDMNRTRLAHIQYLFFLGMNDCNIPGGGSHGGVISDSERMFLAEEEFELAPTTRENVYTEQFYLYLSLTKPSKHLYLTYCEAGNDGKQQNPAYIIDRICKIFPKLSIVVEEKRQDDSYLLGNNLGKDYLIQGLRNQDYSQEKWQEIFRFYKADNERGKVLKQLVEAAFYQEQQTELSKEVVKALYHDILTGSTSQFERYAACAFSYFMRYGLRLKEREEHQVELFDIGNIVHEALELYTKELIKEGKNWNEISQKEQHVRANQCVNAVVERYKNGLLYSTERDTYLITRLRRILARSVWAITKQMELGNFRTVDSEISFEIMQRATGEAVIEKMESGEAAEQWNDLGEAVTAQQDVDVMQENNGVEAEAGEDSLLRLIGRIDRIDSMTTQDAVYLKVVDYKTGKKNISLSDLYYGLQMQLMIYLKAGVTETKEKSKKLVIPAGVLYYNIDDPMVEGKAEAEKVEHEILRGLKMDGLINEDDPVLPSLDVGFLAENGGLAANKSSDILPFATNKEGMLKKNSKTVTTKDFAALMDFTEKKLQTIQEEIMKGSIAVNPYRKQDLADDTACRYCPYHSICRFDTKITGNSYRILEKLGDSEVLYRIEEGEANE